jgi:dimethylamine/trimethylamine dehydrogenase
MPRDPRFDPLFQPLKIGPVTAPNRFWQVPHCSGMGNIYPRSMATMRGIKAEGGWGVVNSKYCSIHPSSDDTPAPYASLWDKGDVANMAAMAEAVHAHGALAGVELWHGGQRSGNALSREAGLSPENHLAETVPWQGQRMDRADIAALRRWHRAAAVRAPAAEFDVVYGYAAHTYLLSQFLNSALNPLLGDYGGDYGGGFGGGFGARSRLVREILEDTRAAVGDRMAVALRIEVLDEDGTGHQERAEFFSQIAHLVDVFDVTIPDYGIEMGPSRFVKEAALETQIAHVRAATGKPVVSVGALPAPRQSCLRSGEGCWISSVPPAPPSPIRSCPPRFATGRWTTSANASAATFVMPMTGLARRSAVHKTPPWAKNGAAVGIPKGCPRLWVV